MYFNIITAAAPASISIKPIPNFDGYYATEDGHIISTHKNRLRILKPTVRQNGYLRVAMRRDDGVRMDRYVHQVILEAFVGPRPSPDHVAAHFPVATKTCCAASNLVWATRSQNTEHWLATNPSVHGGPKLNADRVRDIRKRSAEGVTNRRLADDHDVGLDTIRGVLVGRVWSHVV